MEKQWKQWQTLFSCAPKITADGDCSHKIKRCLFLGRKTMTNLDNILKSEILLYDKGLYSRSYGFSSSPVWMWELDHKEDWTPKNCYFWTVVLEKTLESPLDCKEIQRVHPKGNQSWFSLEILMLKLKLQYFGHLMRRVNSLEKTLMLQKIESRRRKTTEHEMVGWHHWLNGHEFEQAPGDAEGQGSLVWCSPWCCEELDTTERLNSENKQ